MLQIPKRGTQQAASPYTNLGLKDLPFPPMAVSDPYNTDPRRNGTIYAENPVRTSIEKFQQLLIRPKRFPKQGTARLSLVQGRR